ncbi:TIGR02391 family protein [Butyrivibrio proteoclasticus]|uniref:TIGR02391 family protein n=1 Tax=Butyrivibrio proteoclasticus TaxID=43305 RepID=A0A1I5PRG4_9FIRM|nr:TIGR02391 family protein [Butyrivibrio proteoclasticus]SFP36604.1 TIGR02391 family protein [Butyrivibrio proteoclasticus]
MKKINGLEELWGWVLNTNSCLMRNQPLMFQQRDVSRMVSFTTEVSNAIKDDYPFYAEELPKIANNTFRCIGGGFYNLNTVPFGELFIIVKHLHNEPQDASVWTMIHPRIIAIAKEEYLDGHYASAANRSFVEVETRLRELFVELKPSATVPGNVVNLIGALLSENGAYQFCDLSTQSGKDYRRGIQSLFEGSMAAYRNPSSHENQTLSKTEALEQIMLASQLMKVLDN